MIAFIHLFHFFGGVCDSYGQASGCGLPSVNASGGNLQHALEIVFGIIAALAVLMIVIAGLRFVLAQGNPQESAKARSTIIYAIIGLMIALTAEAFVRFVLENL